MPIRNGFDEFVCLRSNLSNDNIISALRPGLKTGMDFRFLVSKRVRKIYIFWSEMRSGFGEPGGMPPPRIPRYTPPGCVLLTKEVVSRNSPKETQKHQRPYYSNH